MLIKTIKLYKKHLIYIFYLIILLFVIANIYGVNKCLKCKDGCEFYIENCYNIPIISNKSFYNFIEIFFDKEIPYCDTYQCCE